MISVNNVAVQFGSRKLFDEVNLKFSKGNKFGGGRGDDCSIVYIKSRR